MLPAHRSRPGTPAGVMTTSMPSSRESRQSGAMQDSSATATSSASVADSKAGAGATLLVIAALPPLVHEEGVRQLPAEVGAGLSPPLVGAEGAGLVGERGAGQPPPLVGRAGTGGIW